MKLYCLAHGADLDGLGCHAIMERYAAREGYEIEHYYVDYYNLGEVVETLPEMKGDMVVLADLGYNPSFSALLEKLDSLGMDNDVSWFDHHDWSAAPVFDNIKFTIDPSTCGSGIVRRHFMPDDEISGAIVALACDHDFRKDNPLAWKLYELIPGKYGKDALMARLAQGEYWDEELEKFYNDYQERKKEGFAFLFDHTKTYDVGALTFQLAYSTDVLSSTLASKELLKKDIDVAICIWPKGKMSFRRNNKAVDIKALAALFDGGGRDEAAGGFFEETHEDNYHEVFDRIMKRIKATF